MDRCNNPPQFKLYTQFSVLIFICGKHAASYVNVSNNLGIFIELIPLTIQEIADNDCAYCRGKKPLYTIKQGKINYA